MSAQQQQQYQQNYEFSAQPMPQARYREPEDYQEDSDYQEYQDEEQYYLEDLGGDIVDENELVPDYFIDRPPTPEFKPLEKGKDVSTQIEDWELFDFEIEVVPVLQLLVGKTIDQARMELIEDSEAEELKRHKALYIKKRNAELLVTQRMENVFLRRKEERERRDQQHKLRHQQNKITHQKMVSRKIAKLNLNKLKENVLDQLEDQGFLKENSYQNIKNNFLPWLLGQTSDIYFQSNNQSQQIQETFQSYNQSAQQSHQQYVQQEQQRRQEVLRQREERRQLLEERKRKKEEYKRKENLKKQRDQILENLEKTVILNSVKIENIFEGQITDIVGDERNNHVSAIFGGLLGQLWLSIGTLNQLLDEEKQLNESELQEFFVHLLNLQLKNDFTIQINDSYKDVLQEKVKLMEEDLFEFEQQKENLINSLIDDTSIFTSFITLNHIKNKGLIQLKELQKIMKILFQIYFTSLDYQGQKKDQQMQEQNEQEQGVNQEGENNEQKEENTENNEQDKNNEEGQENNDNINKEQQDDIQEEQKALQQSEEEILKQQELQQKIEEFKEKLENASQLEKDMVEARKKINLKFQSGNPFESLQSFLRIRIPFLTDEEIEREKAEQEEEELKKKQQDNIEDNASQQNQSEEKNIDDQNVNKEVNENSDKQQSGQEIQPQIEKDLTEEEKEALKYAKYDEFVEIYDGEGYANFLKEKTEKSRRRDIGQENAVLFNTYQQNCALQDERSALFVRGQILHILKELFPEKLENIVDSVFQQKANSIDLEIQEDFLSQIPNKEDLAIFDQNFQQ